jgi:hypothetical protein
MDPWKTPEFQMVLQELLRRTSVDREFRKLALRDPAAAFAQVSPMQIPEGITFRFVDNDGPIKTYALSSGGVA